VGLPTGEIEAAFIARYMGDATLQGLLGNPANPPGNVFDAGSAPTGQPFPYLVVFPITTQQGRGFAFGTDGKDVYVQVSCFTQSGGGAQARAIMKQVHELTHNKPLTLAGGFTNFLLYFDNEQEPPQNDGLTQAIFHRYLVCTQG